MSQFNIYLNPTDGIITIQFASAFSTATIEVTNAVGQIVSSSQTSNVTKTIELPQQVGMYFVLVTVDGITTTSKVVKQ